jgi:hypothetical protein
VIDDDYLVAVVRSMGRMSLTLYSFWHIGVWLKSPIAARRLVTPTFLLASASRCKTESDRQKVCIFEYTEKIRREGHE